MKAAFAAKIKRSRYETVYEVVGKPPHASGFSARGFVLTELDDASLKRLIRRVIAAPAKPPEYLIEMAEASVAHALDMFERFGLESYSADAELTVDDVYDASMSLGVSLYVEDDGDCGDDGAPPCRLVAAAEASCYGLDERHEAMRRADVGNAERGIADKAAVRHVALAALKHAYNACPPRYM